MLDKAKGGAEAKSTVQIDQIESNIGARVSGLKLSEPLSDANQAAISEALARFEVLVFRDQEMTSEQFMAFGRRFADLTVHPFSPADEEAPELIMFRNDENNPPYSTDNWHSDETFRAAPPMGTMLRALDVPEFGGDTMFASMTAAFEGLSDHMQQFISGLEAWHDFKIFRALFGDDEKGRKELFHYEGVYPRVLHPVVAKHPVTGRKVIFVNRNFTTQIKGMKEAESVALLEQLYALASVPEYQYRHHWTNNALVFWDNRSTQHYAVHDYWPKRRFMERVTLAGTPPLPAFEAMDTGRLASNKSPVPSDLRSSKGGHGPKRRIDHQAQKV
jgi:taurine dioxygenase